MIIHCKTWSMLSHNFEVARHGSGIMWTAAKWFQKCLFWSFSSFNRVFIKEKNADIEMMKMADRWLQKGYPYCQMTSPTVFELGNCLCKKMGRWGVQNG